MDAPLEQLQRQIQFDTPLTTFFEQLDSADQSQLAGLVEAALTQQNTTIDEASETALSMVPRVMRGSVKKLLFGGSH